MNKKQKEQRTQIRFPQDVWDELKKLAENETRSFNGEVIFILRDYIARQKGETRRDADKEL